MPPPKKLVESRKLEFLESASRLFLEFGYSDVSIDMLIDDVGGSKGFIYNNFGSKADLFLASIRMLCVRIAAPLVNLDTESMTCRDGLIEIGKNFLDLSLSEESVALNRLVIAERLNFPEIGDVFMNSGPNQTYRAVSTFMARHQRDGVIRNDIDSLEIAKIFLGMLNANYFLGMLSSSDKRPRP